VTGYAATGIITVRMIRFCLPNARGVRAGARCLASVALVSSLACKNAASSGTCMGSTELVYLTTAPNFVAPVSEIRVERGWTPAGFYEVQYNLWLTRSPATAPDVGVTLSDTTPAPTPVFARGRNGTVSPTTVCTINVGDTVEVWHTGRWALGSAEAPPGDTAFEAVQVIVHR
jgi:hypothetical protein